MNALSEGLCLADKSGLSPQTLLDVLVMIFYEFNYILPINKCYSSASTVLLDGTSVTAACPLKVTA